jgi:type VI secretion system protein ImpL
MSGGFFEQLDESANEAVDGSADQRIAQEMKTLHGRFRQAAQTIRSTKFLGPDGEPRPVEQLPWYVIIGAPGSGKTTALLNSGLRFPLYTSSSAASVAGVGGTRNCDWWFSEEAVLLDTAGRYTTQQSHRKADGAAWLGFLALLKKFRPGRPLNGAMVTVSVLDLLLWSKQERARYAAHVRMRLSEMYAAMGVRFPVYALVTKTDLLAGFTEFFGDLDPQARGQVWGTTFKMGIDPQWMAPDYAKDFAALEKRLGAEMLGRLHEEADLQRRAQVYRFPQQYHALGELVGEFLAQAFGTHINHQPIMLRGCYFTSGTQEGNPIDRVLGAMQRAFNLDRVRVAEGTGMGTGRSYFVTRLLREVIFSEEKLAETDAERPAYTEIAAP